jgi:hypothetical protein
MKDIIGRQISYKKIPAAIFGDMTELGDIFTKFRELSEILRQLISMALSQLFDNLKSLVMVL